ncbi:unnamed protein product, partial [Closterium sp. NIES-53]
MFYAIALPVTLGMVIWTLIYYASPRVLQHVRIIVAYTWFVNVSIVILVPVDVWTAICLEGEAGPTGMTAGLSAAVCGSKLSVQFLWSFSYWSAYFLTWVIIPIMQGYEDAGDFTAKERLRTSVRTNLMLIGIVGAVAVVGIIILLATKEMAWDNIVSLAIGASNAFALITGALLLGYGLVEIPRGLWSHADLAERHKWLSGRVARRAQKLDQAHQELSTAIVIAQATSLQMPRHDPLRPMMEIIDAMASEDAGFKPSGGQIGENDMDYDADAKSMAALRRRLRNAQDNYSRCKTEYCTVVWEALQLEETLHNCYQGTGRYTSYLRAPRKGFFAPLLDVVEWWWRCAIRSHVVRAFALLLGLISLAILFAEATLLSQKWVDLSLFSVLVRAAALHGEAVQLIVFVPLVYLCVCTYFSLFNLGIFSFYYLVPAHTDSVSLLINCSMVSRYAAPMCYNFLSLIHLRHYNYATSSVEPLVTVFEKRMGVLPKSFDRVYPLCMVAWSLLIALNVHHRLFDSVTHLLSHFRGLYSRTWRRLRFDDDGERDDVGVDGCRVVVKGHMILQRERATIERGLPVGESVVPLARHFSSKDLHASSSASSLLSGHYSTPTKVPHTDPSSSSSADPLLDSRLAAVRPAGGKPAADSASTKDLESASLLRAADTSSTSVKYSGIIAAAGSSAGGSARKPQRPPAGGASGASSGAASPAAGVAGRVGLEASIKSSSAGDLLPLGREKSRQASVPGSPLLLSRAASPLVTARLPPISTSAHSTPHHLSAAVAAAPAGSVTPTRPLSPPSLLSSALGLSSAAMVSTPQRYFWVGQATAAMAAGAGVQQELGTPQRSDHAVGVSPTESPLISPGQRGAAEGSGSGFEEATLRVNPPSVVFDNQSDPVSTLVKVDSANKQGCLLQVVRLLTDLDLVISKAYISSDGGWFVDVFHVVDQLGQKVTDESLIQFIKKALGATKEDLAPDARTCLGKPVADAIDFEHSVIELTGYDRPGLLYEVSEVLTKLGCNVVGAEVWTHNNRVAIVVHVTQAVNGGPVTHPAALAEMHDSLCSVMESDSIRIEARHRFSVGEAQTDRRLHQLMFADRDYEAAGIHVSPAGAADEKLRPSVSVGNLPGSQYTIIKLSCLDRPKLLFDTVCTLTDMQYIIHHATIESDDDVAFQ